MIFEHYLQLARYYRWLLISIIAGITAAVSGLSVALLFLFPIYTSAATVTVLPSEAELAFTRGWMAASQFSPTQTLLQTHIEYLMSRPVAERALDKVMKAVKPSVPLEGWRADIQKAVIEGIKEMYRIYAILNSGKYVELTRYERFLRRLMDGIELTAVEGSFILEIEVSLPIAEAAAVAANALAEAYVEYVSEQVAATARALSAYFERELETREVAQRELDEREVELRRELGILSLDEERRVLLEAREQDRDRLVQHRIEREELEARLEAFEGKQGELQRRGVLKQVEEEIAFSEARRRAIGRREALRQQSIASTSAKLEAMAKEEKPLLALQQEKARLEVEIMDLRNRRIAVNLAGSGELSQVRVIAPAMTPIYASFPKVVVNTIIAFVGGVVIALFVLVLADTFSGTVKTTADLRRLAGARGLGRLSRRLVNQMSDVKRLGRQELRKKLEALGNALEPRLAALGDFDFPAIQVTGFGSPHLVAGTAMTVAGALVIQGNRVACSLLQSPEEGPPPEIEGPLRQLLEQNPDSESDGLIRVECVGPVRVGFSWQEMAQRSPVLICAIQAGDQLEETVQQFQADASRNGVSGLSFILIEK